MTVIRGTFTAGDRFRDPEEQFAEIRQTVVDSLKRTIDSAKRPPSVCERIWLRYLLPSPSGSPTRRQNESRHHRLSAGYRVDLHDMPGLGVVVFAIVYYLAVLGLRAAGGRRRMAGCRHRHRQHEAGLRCRAAGAGGGMSGLDSIECDGALLAACRSRQALLNHIEELREQAEFEADRKFIRDLLADEPTAEDDVTAIFDDTPTTLKNRAERELATLDAAIAECVMVHLLSPPPPSTELMVLPRRRPAE